MASISETGHAKNVANFQDLIAFVTGYGTSYSPNKAALKLPALNTLYTTSQSKLSDVTAKNTNFNNAVNARIKSFAGIRPLATRLVSALDATDATKEKLNNAKAFNKKLQGRRATASINPKDPNTPAPATISSSQQSYDQMIQHFAGLISVLSSEPSYTPNEIDLKIATLTAKQAELNARNSEVSTNYTAVSNARIDRNKTLYNTDTGLVDIAAEVKKYIKSVYGASSPEFAQVKAIEFKKERR